MAYYFVFVYRWSVLRLRFGLLILSFYPVGSFVLRVEGDSHTNVHVQVTQSFLAIYILESFFVDFELIRLKRLTATMRTNLGPSTSGAPVVWNAINEALRVCSISTGIERPKFPKTITGYF